jgi:hypothetical protein
MVEVEERRAVEGLGVKLLDGLGRRGRGGRRRATGPFPGYVVARSYVVSGTTLSHVVELNTLNCGQLNSGKA